MAKIKIKVSEYYVKTSYYPYMPEAIYCALEKAFIEGSEYAEVDEENFKKMQDDKTRKNEKTL